MKRFLIISLITDKHLPDEQNVLHLKLFNGAKEAVYLLCTKKQLQTEKGLLQLAINLNSPSLSKTGNKLASLF